MIDCTRYGSYFSVFTVSKFPRFAFQVLRSDGQCSAIARSKVLWRYLPRQEWCVQTQLYELGLTCRILQVPVIAVFTKYDQFRREIRMKLEDECRAPADLDDDVEAGKVFEERYLEHLRGPPPF